MTTTEPAAGVTTLGPDQVARLHAEHPEWTDVRDGGRAGALLLLTSARDQDEAAELADILAVARMLLRAERTTRGDLLRVLLPSQALSISPALLEQVHRNAEARVGLAREFGLLTAAQVAEALGSRARNTAALASRLRKEHRLFSVRTEEGMGYPGFQLGAHGAPRPVVADVLRAFAGRLGDWDVALWFTSANGWLGGVRPVDLLDGTAEERDAVAAAARHLADDILA